MGEPTAIVISGYTAGLATLAYLTTMAGFIFTIYAKFRDWDNEKRKKMEESLAERHRRAQEPSLNSRVEALKKLQEDSNEEIKKLQTDNEALRVKLDELSGRLSERIENLAKNQCQCGHTR